MSGWQSTHLAMMLISGSITFFAAVCIDRAERAADGWYHGNAANWRVVAAINGIAFGFNGLCLAVLP